MKIQKLTTMDISKKIKEHLESKDNFVVEEKIILRDFLALERTKLANERTCLSFVQFSLYFFIGGLTILQLDEYGQLEFIGISALVISAASFIIGTLRFFQLKKRLQNLYKKSE